MKLTPIKSNMTEVETSTHRILFSYKTPVAYYNKVNGEFAKTSTKWSRTTSRHINQWLGGQVVVEVGQEYLDKLV